MYNHEQTWITQTQFELSSKIKFNVHKIEKLKQSLPFTAHKHFDCLIEVNLIAALAVIANCKVTFMVFTHSSLFL